MHTTVDYTWLGKLENELRSSRFDLKEIHYLDKVEIETYVEENETHQFEAWMTELTNGQCNIKKGELVYKEELIS